MALETREEVNQTECKGCSDALLSDTWTPAQPNAVARGGTENDIRSGPGDVGGSTMQSAFARVMKSAGGESPESGKVGKGDKEIDASVDYNQLVKSAEVAKWGATDKKDIQAAFTKALAKSGEKAEQGLVNIASNINFGLKEAKSPNRVGVAKAENEDGSSSYFMFATAPHINVKDTAAAIRSGKGNDQVFLIGHGPKPKK